MSTQLVEGVLVLGLAALIVGGILFARAFGEFATRVEETLTAIRQHQEREL